MHHHRHRLFIMVQLTQIPFPHRYFFSRIKRKPNWIEIASKMMKNSKQVDVELNWGRSFIGELCSMHIPGDRCWLDSNLWFRQTKERKKLCGCLWILNWKSDTGTMKPPVQCKESLSPLHLTVNGWLTCDSGEVKRASELDGDGVFRWLLIV